ncbi:ATPase/protein kinase [Ammoniphilus oxalaticus]|uniref:ATPase/protein kinase n=1 Tax=Ammoniphilus oxalaticus TaxID=66863 RepID=A0A419SM11_9BACL|nr:methylmalonyl Co-A mutase-associated GTPase MeaB [Ammoniphilus oxalaticus]RKD25107.1 ATPase/protein kinase [Ammoniphilus oxalaticus]
MKNENQNQTPPLFRKKRMPSRTSDEFVKGVLQQNRTMLAQTITLIESGSPADVLLAQDVLRQLLPYTGKSIRIGVTGPPGAGKSTLIETLGTYLCGCGFKIAALSIDPSSPRAKGSILGDKTRMEKLARHPQAFIRPSPSKGALGGVARKTREAMLVCEAAGYDVIIVETVGVGQSETAVRAMVDFFLLLQMIDAGDELQGIKKGVIELADAILIHKADGKNRQAARQLQVAFNQWLHLIQPATTGWQTKAYTGSSLCNEGIRELWDVIRDFKRETLRTGTFERRRADQAIDWMQTTIKEELQARFYANRKVQEAWPAIEAAVGSGSLPVRQAVSELLDLFLSSHRDKRDVEEK